MPEQIGEEGMYEFNEEEINSLRKSQIDSYSRNTNQAFVSAENILNKFKKNKADYQEMIDMVSGWGDKVTQDGILIEEKRRSVEELEIEFLAAINNYFDCIYLELSTTDEIKSETSIYKTEDIIKKIDILEKNLKEGVPFDIKYITRANGYRDKVEKIVNLFSEYKKIIK